MTTQLFANSLKAKVQPLAIFEILDHYIRRNEGQEEVIGTLLGTSVGGTVVVTSSFPAPGLFQWADDKPKENEVLMSHIRNMYALSQKTSPNEQIVGWYSTSKIFDQRTALTHNFFWGECSGDVSPVLLTVDPSTIGLDLQCFVNGATLTVGDKALIASFTPVNFELAPLEGEASSLRSASRSSELASLAGDLAALDHSLASVISLLKSVTAYVDGVVAGKAKPNPALGRLLVNITGRLLPSITPEYLDKIFTDNLKDLLLVVYLANLTKSQLKLAESLLIV
jgi:translation initiation factor 3 subunit F